MQQRPIHHHSSLALRLFRFIFSKNRSRAFVFTYLFVILIGSSLALSNIGHGSSLLKIQTSLSESNGSLHVDGHNIVDANNNPVNLVGLNYGDYPNDVYPNRFNTGNLTLDALNIKNSGFNVVNLIEEWGYLENSSSPSNYSYDSSAWQLMQSRITALTSQGIYVIVKLHADSEQWTMYNNLMQILGPAQYCAGKGDFLTAMGDSFYSTPANNNPNSGMAHLTAIWLRISNMTRMNSYVIGFDLLNEPWYCSDTTQLTHQQIHDYWYSRVSEITTTIRSHNDNRIIFVEEAPNYDGYIFFRPYPDSNTVSSIHWYKGAYQSSNAYYVACNGDYASLFNYWSNISNSHNGACADQDPQQILQAHLKYPNQAFMVGEFGNIYNNKIDDVSDHWIQSSIQLFHDQGIAGWIYWSSGDDGSWVKDLQQYQQTSSVNVASGNSPTNPPSTRPTQSFTIILVHNMILLTAGFVWKTTAAPTIN